MKKMYEIDMVKDCYTKLKKSNEIITIVLEVPYMSRCIDMVLVDKDYNLITIEFKLKNWKKAIEQAKDHRLGADKSYICLPKSKNISQKLLAESNKSGVGILMWEENNKNAFEEISSPKPNELRWKPWTDSLKIKVNEISGKDIFKKIRS